MSRRLTLLTLAGALALSSFRPYPRLAPPHVDEATGRSPSGRPILLHSHNDYEQGRPLEDALEHRFDSVEADIWWVDGRLLVSHLGWSFSGGLKDLYLDPLQERVRRLGSVHGDGKPFYLWIDLKSRDPGIIPALRATLSGYPMLSRYSADGADRRPVTAILTGWGDGKSAFFESSEPWLAERDTWSYAPADPAVQGESDPWRWYSIQWFRVMEWDGEERIPAAEEARLRKLVHEIHAKGRRLRFWGAPETPGVWEASAAAGVDLLGTDSVQGMAEFRDGGGNVKAAN